VTKDDGDDIDDWEPLEGPYLTKDMFIKVYEKCGKYLHESPPFMTEEEIHAGYTAIEAELKEWTGLIIALLSTHIVHLYNQKSLFYISMGGEENLPHGNIFSAIEE